MKKIHYISIAVLLASSLNSCGDFLDVVPSNQYSDATVFTNTEGAQKVLIGAYDWLTSANYDSPTNLYIFFMPDLMGEDAMVNSTSNYGRFTDYYQYSTTTGGNSAAEPWANIYSLIDNCNVILDNINSFPESNERNRIEGEALALRTYGHHFLIRAYSKPVNKYPDNPGIVLRLTSSTSDIPRSTVKDCYIRMTEDIERACTLLTGTSSSSKYYITDKGAHAIAARVYLDLGDYTKGAPHANKALDGLTLMSKADYKNNFCENNTETIWSFTCTATDKQNYRSFPGFWYYCDQNLTYPKSAYSTLGVAKEFIDIFDDADIRKSLFVKVDGNFYKRNGSFVTCKFTNRKNNDSDGSKNSGTVAFAEGDFNMIRGSEMYLIIAELAADNTHEGEARIALNKVRETRGLLAFEGNGNDLKNAIQLERRRELFAEGHRLFDIKRRNLTMNRSSLSLDWSRVGSLPAGSDKFELPIPQDEIDANGALTIKDQNPAYK